MSSSRPPEAPTAKNPYGPTDQATREEPGRTRKATQETVPAEQIHAVVTDSSARYEERSVLGKGGMGRVILVYDSNLAREVAMKELLVEDESQPVSPEQLERFLREARITGRLQHPAIVPVHELGSRANGSFYYTMKCIRGHSLAAELKKTKSMAERLRLLPAVRDVCQAMAYAHANGVIHRDLKPDNVMLGEFGETIVVDWGIAKVLSERESAPTLPPLPKSSNQTSIGTVLGTPWYMSPEQALGISEELDERSDVWSLGTILYEVLAGRPPFIDRNPMTVVQKLLLEEPPSVLRFAPEAPVELAAITTRALQRKREERYANAKELAAELDAWLLGRTVAAYQYTSWELLRRFVVRNRVATASALLALLALLGSASFVFRSYRSEQAKSREAERARELAFSSEVGARVALSRAMLERAERSLAEGDPTAAELWSLSALAEDPLIERLPRRGEVGITLADREEANARADSAFSLFLDAEERRHWTLERRVQGITGHSSLSPDGSQLATINNGRCIVLSLASGQTRELGIAGVEDVLAWVGNERLLLRAQRSGVYAIREEQLLLPMEAPVSASVAAAVLATSDVGGRITLYDSSTLQIQGTFTHPTTSRSRVLVSPDGTRLATLPNNLGSVFLWTLPYTEASVPAEMRLGGRAASAAFSPDSTQLAVALAGSVLYVAAIDNLQHPRRLLIQNWSSAVWWLGPDRLLVTDDAGASVINAETGNVLERLRGAEGSSWILTYVASDRIVVSPSDPARSSSVYRQAPPRGRARVDIGEMVHAINWDQERNRLLVQGARRVFALPLQEGRLGVPRVLAELPADAGLALTGAVAHDGAFATYTSKGSVFLTEPGGAPVEVLAGSSRYYSTPGLTFDPSGTVLYAGGTLENDGTIRRFHRATRRELPPLRAHQRSVLGLSVASDGRLLASASLDGTVRLWDLSDPPRVLRVIEGYAQMAADAQFSPDGTQLATTDGEGRIRILRVSTGAEVFSGRPHLRWINQLRWSTDGTRLATASDDSTARILDAATLRSLRIVRTSSPTQNSVFSGNQQYFFTYDAEGVCQLDARLQARRTGFRDNCTNSSSR